MVLLSLVRYYLFFPVVTPSITIIIIIIIILENHSLYYHCAIVYFKCDFYFAYSKFEWVPKTYRIISYDKVLLYLLNYFEYVNLKSIFPSIQVLKFWIRRLRVLFYTVTIYVLKMWVFKDLRPGHKWILTNHWVVGCQRY